MYVYEKSENGNSTDADDRNHDCRKTEDPLKFRGIAPIVDSIPVQ